MTANNDLCGRDPADGVVKQLWVDYSYQPNKADKSERFRKRAVIGENASLELPESAEDTHAVPAFELSRPGDKDPLVAWVTQPGTYEAKTLSGKTLRATLNEIPEPLTIAGPWVLRFPPKSGAPNR